MDVNEELKFYCENSSWGGQGGCERRIDVFVKIPKKKIGGWGGFRVVGVRMDVNEELKFFW